MASPEAVTEPKVETEEPGPSTPVETPVKAESESPEAAPVSPVVEDVPEESVEPEIDLQVAELQKEPLFAEICSFFNFFAGYLAMKPMSFTALEDMFCLGNNDQIKPSLIDLHLVLLRKVGYKSARADRWESFLQKFLTYIKMEEEALQLERLGYADLPLATKLEAMFHLCGWQFDSNVKFKETVFNTLHTSELRLAPVGRDMNGLNYWFQRDYDLNVRLYTEEPEDKSGGTWRVVARSHSDLIKLLNNLRSVDFNRSSKESSAEIDEEQAIAAAPSTKTSPSKPAKSAEKSPQTTLDPDFWKLVKPEVAQKYYTYLAKRNSYFDQYRDGSDLNKKKNEKLAKKAAKAAAVAITGQASKQSTPKPSVKAEEEEEPEIPADLLEDRRILPRRNARNAAITNLKSFTTPTRAKKEANAEVKREDTAEPDVSDNDDDDGFEDDDESDRSLGSSDEEFNLPGRRSKGIRRPRRPRADGEGTPKPKKRKKKPQPIAFESSDDEDGEDEEEVKERKKATSQSRCQACEASTHWEVLLLCDMCDSAWHTFCLKPRLWYVPDDDWFCPMCQHAMLVDRLTSIEKDLCEALKVKEVEDAKKKLAAERLKREMEYIGISLNNVVNTNTSKQEEYSESEESEISEDDGQRKSKKRAMKKVMHNNRQRQKQARYYGPVVTVAEGRSRRSTKKVDYNFSAYDEQLQEAMDTIDEPSVKTKFENDHRPAGGAGRGKDMSNIVDADRKRHHDSEDYEDENDAPVRSKKRAKTSKRLTDLNIDDATESETDEYQASEDSVPDEPSEDDYIPSDEERRTRRSGGGGGRRNRQSDDDFIDDSDSDYNPGGGRKRKRAPPKPKRRSGRKKYVSDDSELDDEASMPSESEEERRPKKKAKINYCSDEEPSSSRKKTATGRPMRRAAAKAVLKESDDEELEEDGDEGTTKKKEERPVGALSRRRSKPDDADEFKPDDDEEDEEEEEEEEELEEEEEDDVDEEEEDQGDEPSSDGESTQDAPTMVKKTPTKKAPPKRRAPTPPPVAKKLPPPERVPTPTPPPKKEATPAVAPQAAKPSPKPTVSAPEPIHLQPAEEPSTSAAAPPPTSSVAMAAPVPLLPSGVPAHSIHGFAPPPTSTFYGQPGQPIRFAQPGMYGGPPPPGYYPGMPPPMGYPPHPQMVPHGYMLQPPHTSYGHPHPNMLQPQFQSSMTLLEPMHSHLGPPPPLNAYSGLQPIQLAPQPSDADGLAQAITGALNDL